MLGRMSRTIFERKTSSDYEEAIARAIQRVLVEQLIQLASTARMPDVRAAAAMELGRLRDRADKADSLGSEVERAHFLLIASDIRRYQERGYTPDRMLTPVTVPPGSPIGDEDEFDEGWGSSHSSQWIPANTLGTQSPGDDTSP
jgi:hypothetical protein